jgi:hypothetical protein
MNTFLYIKQHNITKKLYFGKTTTNPETYKGSGLHWKHHYKQHGKDNIDTLWYCLYTDTESLTEAATTFSKLWNIVESEDWLNLVEENGLDGGDTFSSNKNINKIKQNLKSAWTNERKTLQSFKTTNMNRTTKTCPHCNKTGKGPNMSRYHFDNCNLIKPRTKKQYKKNTHYHTKWVLLSPNNETITITNLRQFCKDNNLNCGYMSALAAGNHKQHKGWKVLEAS